MKEHHFALSWLSSVALVGLLVLGMYSFQTNTEVVLTAKVVYSSPCSETKCYYAGDVSKKNFCYNSGEKISTSIPDLSAGKICLKNERLTCFNGRWIYDESPKRECV
ncbi:MAG: hypothetical protein AABX39_05745 [Nanoarchaeota archaeon]